MNGMDVEEWDPRVDKYLTVKYDKTNVYAGKAAAKAALQVRHLPPGMTPDSCSVEVEGVWPWYPSMGQLLRLLTN